MLLAIREKVQGWVAWAIVAVLIVPFALWGIDQYASGDKQIIVAKVNGEQITATEFLNIYNRQRIQMREEFGEAYDQLVDDQRLRLQVIESMVNSSLIKQWAQKNGLIISDQQLSSMLQAADAFHDEDGFSQAVYEEVLLRNGLTVGRFETDQRNFLLENQFNTLIADSMLAYPNEVERLLALQAQERDIDYLKVNSTGFLDLVEVTDFEVSEFYQDNLDAYLVEEKVKVDYLVIDKKSIAQNIEATEEEAENFYELNVGLFTTPETRRAKHILITGKDEVSKAKVAEVQQQLAAGTDFESLAKEFSEDPGSSHNGGDLGYFEEGMMVPEFDNVVFTMKVGSISELVETDFGFHIIKLEDIKEQTVKSYSDVKQEVFEQVKQEKAQHIYIDQVDKVNTLAYEMPDSLEPLLDILPDAKIKTSEAFGQAGAELGYFKNPSLVKTVFSEEIIKEQMNSSVVEVDDSTSIVFRVNTYYPEEQQKIAEVKDEIIKTLTKVKTSAAAAKMADEILEKVKAGEKPAKLVESGVEWHQVGFVPRQNQLVSQQITAAAFQQAKPAEKSSWSKIVNEKGDAILIRVNAVKVSDEEFSADQKSQLAEQLVDLYQQAEADLRVASLRANAEVEIRQRTLETLKF